MRRRFVVSMLFVVIGVLTVVGYSMAYGVDLSFPAARRSKITQGYHNAYDYRFANHTSVVAAKAGTVDASRWTYDDNNNWWPCYGDHRDRGNYIILDHGGGVETRYYHLSNTGNTPGVDTDFDRGDYMARSDDTGCSDRDHLHFAVLINGNAVDPYAGTTHWVSGSPIPMGFRNQDGMVYGPYAIDKYKIHQKWLTLEGEPGSPLEDDWWTYGEPLGSRGPSSPKTYIQSFERGYIYYIGSGSAQYEGYAGTYLPDIKIGYNGWNSTIVVRNNNASETSVNVTFYDQDGKAEDTRTYTSVPANGVWILDTAGLASDWTNPVTDFSGSAVVAADQDVSVVVENQSGGGTQRTNYNGILASGGSPGWEEAGSTLYAPVVKRQHYGRSSTIHITNAGAQETTVYVYYYDDNGGARWGGSYALSPNGKATISPSGSGSGGCGASGAVCSARVYSNNGQPLAGVVQEYNDGDGKAVTTHNLFSAGASSIYFPIVKYTHYNESTGLRIQNVGSAGAWITVRYYRQDGTRQCTRWAYASRFAARTFYESTCPGDGFLGSVVASASQPLVGMANEVSLDGRYKKGYSSFQGGSHTAYGPLVYRTYYQGGYTWDAGIGVQNLSTEQANVTLDYYYANGNSAGSQSEAIAGRGIGVFFAPQSGFKGSVRITADRDIAAIVNVINDAPSGDTNAIYNASNR